MEYHPPSINKCAFIINWMFKNFLVLVLQLSSSKLVITSRKNKYFNASPCIYQLIFPWNIILDLRQRIIRRSWQFFLFNKGMCQVTLGYFIYSTSPIRYNSSLVFKISLINNNDETTEYSDHLARQRKNLLK